MILNLGRRRAVLTWQLLFVMLGTTWLWAPLVNHVLSPRSSFISHYEALPQPYGWLFRICDVLAAGLLLYMARFLLAKRHRVVGALLVIISLGMALDSIAATTCHVVGTRCVETPSSLFWVHAIESVATALTLAALAIYDIKQRKRLITMGFFTIQLSYGILFIGHVLDRGGYATLTQFIYESSIIIWLAWLCREVLCEQRVKVQKSELKIIKNVVAIWAAINGVLAILISLAHIHLLGRISGLYFAGNNAWLAQHGVIIGVVMLYISRHLARGEMRARQIFLGVVGMETIKYSVITPHPLLLGIYASTFVLLFVLRDDFDRGTLPLTWSGRLKDLYFMVGGLATTALLSLILLDRDSKVAVITGHAFSHFPHYALGGHGTHGTHLRSVLLAHTISVFLAASVASILWILFRPYRHSTEATRDYARVQRSLERYSTSTEDFFKLWPTDKSYFWGSDEGFVAYKQVGSAAFVLADPVGPDKKQLLDEFVTWCKARRLTTCVLPVYQGNLTLYQDADFDTVQMGSSAVISLDQFLDQTVTDKWWRWQRNRATKAGYEYRRSSAPHSGTFIRELQSVSNKWLGMGNHVERGFSLGYFDTHYMQQCDIHYLVNDRGHVVAFTNQLPQFTASKTATIDLLRFDPEHSNSMPFLLYKTMDWLHESTTYQFFDLGFVPFAGAKGPLLQIAKTIAAGRFSAKGLEQFKNKFDPDWQPNYLAYNGDVVDLALIGLNLERAMSLENVK